MEITLKRHYVCGDAVDGILKIGDEIICETSEHRDTAIAAGEYEVKLTECEQYGRVMPVVGEPQCNICRLFGEAPAVGINSVLPIRCPMLKPGNGVVGRKDSSICVGMHPRDGDGRVLHGMMIHPVGCFEKVMERMKGAERVKLKVE